MSAPRLVLDNTPFMVSVETEQTCVEHTLTELARIGEMKERSGQCDSETVANVLAIAIIVRARRGLTLR